MRSQKLFLILAFVMFLSLGTAFSADIEPIDSQAKHDSPAEFRLTVNNNFSEETTFQISSINAPSSVIQWIDYPRYITAGAGESGEAVLTVTPPENAVQGTYKFRVNIRDYEHDEIRKVSGSFSVRSEKSLHIQSFDVSETEVEPGDEVSGSITLLNTDQRTIEDFQVTAEFFNRSSTKEGYELPSATTLTHDFSLKTPEDARPGEEEFSITVNSSEQLEKVSQTVEVQEIREITRSQETRNLLLYSTEKLSAANKGNDVVNTEINTTLPSYLSSLTVFSPEADEVVEKDGENLYRWNVELEPGETASVEFTIRYWIMLIGLLVLLGVFLLFKLVRSPVKISKTTVDHGEGVKIRIELENSSSKQLKALSVKDYVPNLATVDRKFEMVSPIVRKTKDHTELEWEIESMTPGEQRVFEYVIHPAGVSEGSITLPAAEVRKNGDTEKTADEVDARFEEEE